MGYKEELLLRAEPGVLWRFQKNRREARPANPHRLSSPQTNDFSLPEVNGVKRDERERNGFTIRELLPQTTVERLREIFGSSVTRKTAKQRRVSQNLL